MGNDDGASKARAVDKASVHVPLGTAAVFAIVKAPP